MSMKNKQYFYSSKTKKLQNQVQIYDYLGMTIKEMYDRFVGPGMMAAGCLELSAYNS